MVATLRSGLPAGKPAVAPAPSRPEFEVAPNGPKCDSRHFMPASSAFSALRAWLNTTGRSPLRGTSAQHRKTHHMSDNNQSGAPSTAPGAASTGENPGFGAFGANRGSGLARGKRPAPAAAGTAAHAAPSGYKPSALEVITSKSEYVNPFTGETTVSAPVVNEPASPLASAKVEEPQAAPSASVPAPAMTAPVAPMTAPAVPAADLFPLDAPARSSVSPEKAELKILPSEEPKRPAVSWESNSPNPAEQPRRDERATFRTERNRRESGEGRDGKSSDPREPRRDERKFEPREKQPYQPRQHRDDRDDRTPRKDAPAAEKKSGGFFGWLKDLFGGKKPADAPSTTTGGGGDPRYNREGENGGRRRHRGGRGRGRGGFQGDNRGGQPYQPRDPRDEPSEPRQGGGDYQQGEPRGDGQFSGGHRRRRGGRGRFRDEGGDRGGPRPEGQQGGGAI